MEPDILYVVRPGERNESLKLSLRSLAHIPHRRVFISGYCPAWVRGVTAVEVRRVANKFDSIENNVRKALEHPELADDIVYMNDDFYVTTPVDRIPVMHGGPIDQYQGQQELKIRMRQTLRTLRSLRGETIEFTTYDGVHTPLPIEKTTAINALSCIPKGALWRTYYGNLAYIGGTWVTDTKIRKEHDGDLPTFVSTNLKGLRAIREQLNDLLPERTPYVW